MSDPSHRNMPTLNLDDAEKAAIKKPPAEAGDKFPWGAGRTGCELPAGKRAIIGVLMAPRTAGRQP